MAFLRYCALELWTGFYVDFNRKLDFMCLTETWQNQMDFLALNQATPQGYSYIQKPRSSGRGGGLAVIHHADFQYPTLLLSAFICSVWATAATSGPCLSPA